MKKFLSSLAILVIVLGMTSVVMAKSFSDVKGTKYAEAVDILSELKVVDGYEDGTYGPKKAVKRSEMAKLIVVALGKESSAELLKGSTNFGDVSSKHWASGYINLASSLGIIKGYPDGSFKPDDTVSYVEAVTMLLRALNYNKELDNLSWPKGYMTKANSAGLLDDVVANNSSEDAIRGNVALMILNTLKGYTRKIVATNNTGAIYGNDDILLEKTFDDFIYVEEGRVTGINVDKKLLTVEDENNDRKIEILYNNESNIKKVYGRKLSFIYNEDEEKLYSFKTVDKYVVDVVGVVEIDEKEDILIDEDDEKYDLPKEDNILFVGATRYEDVNKAYITFDEKDKIVCMVLEGPEKIYAGLVSDSSITINNQKGIEILNTDDDYEELVLANKNAKVYADNVILYTYNSDNKINIKTLEDVEDALGITSVSSTSIKLSGKTQLTFKSTSEYNLYIVDGDYIEKSTLSKVDSQYDKATALKYNDIYYIIVFKDSVAEEDMVANVSVSEAKKSLDTALKNAKKKINSETTYSVKTIEALKDAYDYGQKIYSSATSYSAAKIQLATRDINDAIANLKKKTSDDDVLRSAFKSLESKIKEIQALDSADYTAASWKVLNDALTEAKKIKIESTTKEKVTTATNNLTSKKNLLVTNASAEQITEALTRLDAAIKDAEAKKSSDYSSASYQLLAESLKAAKELNRSIAGAREINTVASNLEAAIDDLLQANFPAYETERKKLDDIIKVAEEKDENEYTATTWNIFFNLYDGIETKYEALKDTDDVKKLANSAIPEETNKVKALYKETTDAIGKLVLKTDATTRTNSINAINKCILKFEEYTETTWAESDLAITFAEMKTKIDAAKLAVSKDETATNELKTIANDLTQYFSIY